MNIRSKIISLVFVFVFCINNLTSLEASTAKDKFETTINLNPNSTISIVNVFGNVIVHTWNNQKLRVIANITAFGKNTVEAKKLLSQIEIGSQLDSLSIIFSTIAPILPYKAMEKGFFSFLSRKDSKGYTVDYEIWVPAVVNLDIKTSRGTINIDGISGNIKALTTEFGIDITNANGSIKAYTTNAPINAQILILSSIDYEFSSSNSDITISIPANSKVTLKAEAQEGAISNNFDIIKMGKFTDQVQYGWINGGGVPFNIFTKNGKITLSKF